MSWWTKHGRRALKNTALAVAAPFTAGLSTLAMEDDAGNSVMGTITGENSAREQNRKQQKLQQQTNDTSIALANSAHQREVADLKAAGLNPVLSAGGSGAVTPTLGTAQVQNTLPGGALAQAQTAGQVASLFSSAKQMSAQAKSIPSQTRLQNAQAQLAEDQDEFYQDTGYFPGASESTSGGAGGFGFNFNKQTTTPIRNPKKNSGRQTWEENNKETKEMDDNYNKTKKKEQERIDKLKNMGWHKSMTTHR